MKKMKKGFTIIELVIVIAVIGILASVLIPTFSSLIGKAKKDGKALEEAKNAMTVVQIAEEVLDEDATYYVNSSGYWYKLENGELTEATAPEIDAEDVAYAKVASPEGMDEDIDTATVLDDLVSTVIVYKVK